jgi:hypothetical protein
MRATTMLAAAVLAATAAVPVSAADSPGGGSVSGVQREGFLVGFSLGAGDLGPDPCRDCGVGVGGDFHIGAMAGRSAAVMLEITAVGRGDLVHGVVGVAGQWWPDPEGRFWLKGGVGIGSLNRDGDFFPGDPDILDGNNDYVYPSLFGAAGVEAVRSGRFTIDIQLRGAGTHQRGDWAHSVSVNVGLNWY